MDMETDKKERGRPPITQQKEKEIEAMLLEGKPPTEIAAITGVSVPKVYQIRSHWKRRAK